MKKVYDFGDDLFLAIAFVTFAIGIVTRLLGIDCVLLGITITAHNFISLSMMSLIFSIALSLYELAKKSQLK